MMFPGCNCWEEYLQLIEMREWEDKPLTLDFSLASVIYVESHSANGTFLWVQQFSSQ